MTFDEMFWEPNSSVKPKRSHQVTHTRRWYADPYGFRRRAKKPLGPPAFQRPHFHETLALSQRDLLRRQKASSFFRLRAIAKTMGVLNANVSTDLNQEDL